MNQTAHPGIEELSREECLSLLARHRLGRLAVMAGDHPDLVPVNYSLGRDAIVVHTRVGGLLDRATRQASAFEIDGVDEQQRAWSVTVRGVLEDITDAGDRRSHLLQGAPAVPMAPGPRTVYLALATDDLSGRRFSLPPFGDAES